MATLPSLQSGKFLIKTDHESFKNLLSQKLTHTLQHKSLCKLLGLDYEIQYKKGKENVAADALSRRAAVLEKSELNAITTLIRVEELASSYIGDEFAQQIISELQ